MQINIEATSGLAPQLQHPRYRPGTRCTAAGRMNINHGGLQTLMFRANMLRTLTAVIIRTACHFKDMKQLALPVLRPQLLDQGNYLIESDIKSAVAFFRISFSRSTRRTLASSS